MYSTYSTHVVIKRQTWDLYGLILTVVDKGECPRSMCKSAWACRASAVCGLWKNLQGLIYSKLHSKSWGYVLIIYMKKYDIAYHNYAEAKCMHQVQK